MSEPTNSAATKPRATIIIDANVLLDLACPIKDENFAPGKPHQLKTYLDLLPFLARHGYQILIPEMVAYETARILASGFCASDLLPDKYVENPARRAFLEDVVRGKFPNIEIVANTGPEKVDKWISRITHAIRDPLSLKWNVRPNSRAAELLRSQIVENLETKNRDDYGDDAILSLLGTLRSNSDSSYMVVLSNDKDFRDRLPQTVERLDTRSFIHHLVDSGLHRNVGLASDISPETIAQQIHVNRQLRRTAKQEGYLRQFAPDHTESFVDRLHHTDSRLFRGLKGLRKEINRGQETEIKAPVEEPYRRSAAAQRLFDLYEAKKQKNEPGPSIG